MTSGEPSNSPSHPLQTTIYLDCNATTHTHPLALQAAREAMELCYGNPSSTHLTGLHAKSFLESARDAAALAIGANSAEEIIFNSGATEGIQSSVFSALVHMLDEFRETGRLSRWRILYGATEHRAVPAAIAHWSEVLRIPVEIEAIPVNESGILDLEFIELRLHESALICTMAVNNETGVIQPLEDISSLINSSAGQGCLWFVDGVQALGKIKINLSTLGVHYSCFSGHKLNAPKGIGFLWVRFDAPYTPMIVGGGQERGKRSGTENLPGAAAFGRILRVLNDPNQSVFLNHQQLEHCRQQLISTLTSCFPTLVWNADLNLCVPTTLNFSVEGISSRELMNAFDAAGVRVSGGSACSSGKASGSHVLIAMNLPKWRTQNAIRLSFGPASSETDISAACTALRQAGDALRASCMIPNLPARVDQAAQYLQQTGHGISELRSSDGTRAWLVICDSSYSFLISDCEHTLSELKHKLACRGLQNTHLLRLDSPLSEADKTQGWQQLKSSSGASLLFQMQSRSAHEAGHSQQSTLLLFAPFKECLLELFMGSQRKIFSGSALLACFACEPTALTAYEFQKISTSENLVEGADHRSNHLSSPNNFSRPIQVQIEFAKEEIIHRLHDQSLTILDVREAFESATSHLDDILRQMIVRKNEVTRQDTSDLRFEILPLSRLPQFIVERLNQPRTERILCVCRSGQRSLQAAELLRRLPGCEAFSLKGGLADLLAPTLSLPPRSVTSDPHGR